VDQLAQCPRRSCRFRDAHALEDDRRRSPLRARRSASGSPMRLLMRAEAGNEPASGERVYLQLPACSPSRRRQRLLVRLWGQLRRPCRVLGAATDSWSLQRWCSAAMTRCGRARLAAGATEIVSTPRLVGIRTLCRSSRFSGSGPSGSGVNMPQAHNVGDEARTEEERIGFSFCHPCRARCDVQHFLAVETARLAPGIAAADGDRVLVPQLKAF
jgi:hypothetical protein